MSDDWSREEVEAVVSDYLDMLAMELRGEPFNKADHNRNLQKILERRSRGSIEKKHQNVSAVLIKLGYPYIDGYKPLPNYQGLLYDVIEGRLFDAGDLAKAAATTVERPFDQPPVVDDLLGILVDPPRREETKYTVRESALPVGLPVRRNFLEIESRNRTLGLAGEKLVLEFEHKRLWEAGKNALANRIEHISDTEGDHLGFDIASFEIDGRDRLIEVKTTRFGALTPFFASKNEVEVSEMRRTNYQLYRLFKFSAHPKLFVLPGSLRATCSLDPTHFSALPR